MVQAYAVSNKVVNSSGQSLASRSGGAIRSGHSYIDSLGYSSLLTSQHPNCTDELVHKRTKLSGCMAAWMRSLIRLLSAVAPFRFSLASTLPLCGAGAQHLATTPMEQGADRASPITRV